jgi:hypothetical protein
VPGEPATLLRASVDPSGPAGLATAAAFADSLDTGIRLVRVRIVDTLDLEITLRSEAGVVLAEPPVLCLHWIDAAPDDAGLESPCWGVPDPSTELAASMVRDDGSWVLDRAQTVAVHARLTRGGRRCDYPPGAWILRVRVVPLVDGVVQPPMYTEAPFEVAYERTDVPTRLPLSETRFFGLASEVIREQGAPPTPAP